MTSSMQVNSLGSPVTGPSCCLCHRVTAVMEGDFEDFDRVEIPRIALKVCLAQNVRLDAAADAPVTRFLQGEA